MKLQTLVILFVCGVSTLEAGEFFHAKGTDYYMSYPMRANWFQSQRFCNYYGLHLISIHSFEEEQIILSIISQFKAKNNITTEHIHLYTSGTDMGYVTNEFYWITTGHPFIYRNWIAGYPNAERTKPDLSGDCVILNDQNNLKWHNINCSNNYFFMCQNRITVPDVDRAALGRIQCESN